MRFEWDAAKNKRNRAKHGVSFEVALEVFHDPLHLSKLDRVVSSEERWLTLGRVADQVVLVVAHTQPDTAEADEVICIISARKATKRERRAYEHWT